MKNLLVATDFSAAATNAVEYAAQLARTLGAELTLFNVFKLDVHAANARVSSANIEHHRRNNEKQLEDLAVNLAQQHQLHVKWACLADDTIERLREYVAQHPVGLVVMGIESNLPEYKLFGNTTTAAIKVRGFPVLVVPNGVSLGDGLKRVLYACDPARVRDGSELGLLRELLTAFAAHLDVLHVFEQERDEAVREQVERLVDGAVPGHHEYRYFTHQKATAGIQECLRRFPTELLVMLSHELGFWESLTSRSHTRQMTVTTRVPLLVLPGRSR